MDRPLRFSLNLGSTAPCCLVSFRVACPADDGQFEFHLREDAVSQQAALDGYYFLQSDATDLEASQILEAYKTLQRVERAFRDLKDTIKLRPIHHYDDARVRGHVFVCLLSYLLDRMLELRLEDAGHPLSVRRAMEALESVKGSRYAPLQAVLGR